MTTRRLLLFLAWMVPTSLIAQGPRQPDWTRLEDETMRHFQALLRFDTSNPPGNEVLVTDYLKETLGREGILVQIFASDQKRPNLVARIKGSGRKRPVLYMGHTDVCYGIGPAIDFEDGPKGYGAHSDQERILEANIGK